MSTNLDRSADALLQQKALQTTHHERLSADAQQASRALRVAFQNTRDSVVEVRRLREDLRDVREETAQLEKAFESQHLLRLSMLSALRVKGVDEADAAVQQLESVGMRWVGVPARLGKVDAQLDAYQAAENCVNDCLMSANDVQQVVTAALDLHNIAVAADELSRVLYHTTTPAEFPLPPSNLGEIGEEEKLTNNHHINGITDKNGDGANDGEMSSRNDAPQATTAASPLPFVHHLQLWETTIHDEATKLQCLTNANTNRIAQLGSTIADHEATTASAKNTCAAVSDRLENVILPELTEKQRLLSVLEEELRVKETEVLPHLAATVHFETNVVASLLEEFVSGALQIAREAAALPEDVLLAAKAHRCHIVARRAENQERKVSLAILMSEKASIASAHEELSAQVVEHQCLLLKSVQDEWCTITKARSDLTAKRASTEALHQTHRTAAESLKQHVDAARQERVERMIALQAAIATLLMETTPALRLDIEREEEAAFHELNELQLSDFSATIERAAVRQQKEMQEQLRRERDVQQQQQRRQREFDEMRKATLVMADDADDSDTPSKVEVPPATGHAPAVGRPTTAHRVVEVAAADAAALVTGMKPPSSVVGGVPRGAAGGALKKQTQPLVPPPPPPPPPQASQKSGVVVKSTATTAAAAVAGAKRGLAQQRQVDSHHKNTAPPPAAAPPTAKNLSRAPSLAFSSWSADVPLASLLLPSTRATAGAGGAGASQQGVSTSSGNGGARMVGRHQAVQPPPSSQRGAAVAVVETPSPQPRQPISSRRVLPISGAAGGGPPSTAGGKVVVRPARGGGAAAAPLPQSQAAPPQMQSLGTSLAAAFRRPAATTAAAGAPISSSQPSLVSAAGWRKLVGGSTTQQRSNAVDNDDDEFDVFAQ